MRLRESNGEVGASAFQNGTTEGSRAKKTAGVPPPGTVAGKTLAHTLLTPGLEYTPLESVNQRNSCTGLLAIPTNACDDLTGTKIWKSCPLASGLNDRETAPGCWPELVAWVGQ